MKSNYIGCLNKSLLFIIIYKSVLKVLVQGNNFENRMDIFRQNDFKFLDGLYLSLYYFPIQYTKKLQVFYIL